MIPSNDLLRPDNQEVRVTLPWPNKLLSPNSRSHWAVKAASVKGTRGVAQLMVRATIGPGKLGWSRAALDVVFCPPDRRRRDLDNCIASFKSSSDGISDALGVDDSRFVSTYRMGSPIKGGAVHVTIARAV